jgi:hypothetical protein
MRTETGVQAYWTASLAWKRVPGFVEGATIDKLFRILDPLYHHKSQALARQAESLGQLIVKGRIYKARPRKKQPNNIVHLRIVSKQETIAA